MTDTLSIAIGGVDLDIVLDAITAGDSVVAEITVDREIKEQGALATDPVAIAASIGFMTTTAIYAVVRIVIAELERGRQIEILKLVGRLPPELAREVREAAKRFPSLNALVPAEDPKPPALPAAVVAGQGDKTN